MIHCHIQQYTVMSVCTVYIYICRHIYIYTCIHTYVYMIHHHLQKPTTSANRSNCPAILVCICLQQAVHHFGMSIFCSQKQGSCPRLRSKGIKLHTQKLSSFQPYNDASPLLYFNGRVRVLSVSREILQMYLPETLANTYYQKVGEKKNLRVKEKHSECS